MLTRTLVVAGVEVISALAACPQTYAFGGLFHDLDKLKVSVLLHPQEQYFCIDCANLYLDNLQLSLLGNTPAPVPLPAAGWLLGSGLAALGVIRRRKAG